MVSLLKDRKLMWELGQGGRKKALCYDWKTVAKQVLDFYCEVMNKKS
jgi:glycosyltransferase involved in cell wall biosynthesis